MSNVTTGQSIKERALAAWAAKKAAKEQQEAIHAREQRRIIDEKLAKTKEQIREKLGALYDELLIDVEMPGFGLFTIEGVNFRVSVEQKRDVAGVSLFFTVWVRALGVYGGGVWFTNADDLLCWIGKALADHDATLEAGRAKALEEERLKEVAIAQTWKWPPGYVLNYSYVRWNIGSGCWDEGYTLKIDPDEGDGWLHLLHGSEERVIKLTHQHMPVWERRSASSIAELPSAWKWFKSVQVQDRIGDAVTVDVGEQPVDLVRDWIEQDYI